LPEKEKNNKIKLELTGITLLFFAVFIIVALATWSPEDPPNPQKYSGKDGIKNFCGYFGAHISYYLFRNIGVIPSYIFATTLILLAFLLIANHLKMLVIRIVTAEFLVFSASIMEFHLLKGVFQYRVEGGIIGRFLTNTLVSSIGTAGTALTVCFAFVLCLFTLIDAPFSRILTSAVNLLKHSISKQDKDDEQEEKPKIKMPRLSFSEIKQTQKELPIKPLNKKLLKIKADKCSDKEEKIIPSASNNGDYKLPPISYLEKPTVGFKAKDERSIEQGGKSLAEALAKLGIEAEVVGYEVGPSFISYRVRVADSVRLNKVKTSATDLAFKLGVMSSLTIEGPLDGEPDTVAVQIPRETREIVRVRELIPDEEARSIYASSMRIPLFLGRKSTSEPFVVDLTNLPHLLIAGATGSGKSICIHSILISILMTRTPNEVRLILIDPKMVELTLYADVPHLLVPVVEEMEHALSTLIWASAEMDRRYRLLRTVKVSNIAQFNEMDISERRNALEKLLPEEREQFKDGEQNLPHIVIVVEELADLSQSLRNPIEVERALQRIAQKARAVGIHLVLSTQRPSVDVVKGLVKANLPARIAFYVPSAVDSRTILDTTGAEKLLGKGDMLYRSADSIDLHRAQGVLISENERERIVNFVKEQRKPDYRLELFDFSKRETAPPPAFDDDALEHKPRKRTLETVGERDELFDQSVEIVLKYGRASISRLQRELGIGYERAAKIMDQMEAAGIVGPEKGGARSRDVLITSEQWEARAGASAQNSE